MNKSQPIKNKEKLDRFKNFYIEEEYNPRNYMFISLGLNTALRVSDLLKFTWNDVYNFDNGCFRTHVKLTEQKTTKQSVIFLNSRIINSLSWYKSKALIKFLPETFLFSNADNRHISRSTAYRIVHNEMCIRDSTFPIYIGAMLAAALMRNICEYTGIATIHMGEINDLGGISLSLFLGMAMITLRLWELASLALPLVILLAAQVLLIIIFTYVIEFNIMGRDYDAAILVSGTCGFGTGATPNAMANMQAVCDQYVPSIKAYLLIPLVGSLFADFLNSLVITFFINLM